MEKLRMMLLNEEERMEKFLVETTERLHDAPLGNLRLSRCGKTFQYYLSMPGDKKRGAYIPKAETRLIRRLAQKSYDEKISKLAAKRLAQIRKITKDYEDDEIQEKIQYYESLKPVDLLTQNNTEGDLDKYLVDYGDKNDSFGNSYTYKLSCGDLIKMAYFVRYALDGKYSTLDFDLALNDEYKDTSLEIWIELYDENGNLIFESNHLGAGDRPEHFSVDISGINDLYIYAWKSGQEFKYSGPMLTNGFWVAK